MKLYVITALGRKAGASISLPDNPQSKALRHLRFAESPQTVEQVMDGTGMDLGLTSVGLRRLVYGRLAAESGDTAERSF